LDVYEETPRAAHIQRCTYIEHRGGRYWQCKLTDPHPDVGHDLGIDAEFGRVLHEQRPDWLAGQLRDRVALARHLQRRIDDQQVIALDLLSILVLGGAPTERTREWARNNAPGAARAIGWI
jgi:hypothetical protein